jgi:hypothetical protein
MSAGTDEVEIVPVDLVKQKPIRFDVAISVMLPLAA